MRVTLAARGGSWRGASWGHSSIPRSQASLGHRDGGQGKGWTSAARSTLLVLQAQPWAPRVQPTPPSSLSQHPTSQMKHPPASRSSSMPARGSLPQVLRPLLRAVSSGLQALWAGGRLRTRPQGQGRGQDERRAKASRGKASREVQGLPATSSTDAPRTRGPPLPESCQTEACESRAGLGCPSPECHLQVRPCPPS